MRFIVDVKISINNIAQVIPTGWKMHETKRYKEGFSNFNIQRRRRTNLWKAKTHLFWTVTYVFVAIPQTLPFSVAFLCLFLRSRLADRTMLRVSRARALAGPVGRSFLYVTC